MHWDDHPPPHVHVDYAEHQAAITIDTLEVMAGRLPRRARALFLEWAMLHRTELRHAWDAAREGSHPGTIEPLA